MMGFGQGYVETIGQETVAQRIPAPLMTRKAYLLQGVSFLALVAAWGAS